LKLLAVKLFRSEQFIRLGFFVGGTVGMDGSGLDRFIQAAGKSFGQLGSGGIAGGDSGTQFFLNGFQFADSGTVAEVRFFAGGQTFDGRLGMRHIHFSFILYKYKKLLQTTTDY
jgi:hypothetical protein